VGKVSRFYCIFLIHWIHIHLFWKKIQGFKREYRNINRKYRYFKRSQGSDKGIYL
jgi:hypothetical protein